MNGVGGAGGGGDTQIASRMSAKTSSAWGSSNIGRDVRVYITEQLKKIPEQAKGRAIALRAIERV